MTIKILENEHWWGGLTDLGASMPLDAKSDISIKMSPIDQGAFLFLSDKGRYIYSSNKHGIKFSNGEIEIDGDTEELYVEEGFETLRGAHLAVVKRFFKPEHKIPDASFFETAQFNTWMALGYNQNEEDILEYAQSILDKGFKPGVLMIDEGWSEDYGVFDFYPGKFRDPKGMIDKLHAMGFKVMLWVTPNISPDSNAFREINPLGYLVKNSTGEVAIRKWWNGFSCVLDLTNPDAFDWFVGKLNGCLDKYGADGFKFDAGDWYFYRDDDVLYERKTDNEMTAIYNSLGKLFDFHEFRTAWNALGSTVFCRMQDKLHAWDKTGIASIIPNSIVQGLIGCLFCCPDMVGGGALESATAEFDTELYLRWTEANAYCAMMQFSIAPWKILDENECNLVKLYAEKHNALSGEIVALAENASNTGEPVIRAMEYEFPGQGFEKTINQFMLGSNILVAPVVEKGVTERTVKLPCGRWESDRDGIFDGGKTITVNTPIDYIPVFRRVN